MRGRAVSFGARDAWGCVDARVGASWDVVDAREVGLTRESRAQDWNRRRRRNPSVGT